MKDLSSFHPSNVFLAQGEHGDRFAFSGHKLNLEGFPLFVGVHYRSNIAALKPMRFDVSKKDYRVEFFNHRFRSFSFYAGYAVTNRGRSSPVPIIHTVLTFTTRPCGVSMEPSTTCFVPRGVFSVARTSSLRAMLSRLRSSRSAFSLVT